MSKFEITPEMARQLVVGYEREIKWFKNHGVDYHTHVNNKTGQATPAHKAWVKVCEDEHEISGASGSLNFPISRRMFILGYLKAIKMTTPINPREVMDEAVKEKIKAYADDIYKFNE